jgi:hypothetical protein
VVDGLQFNCLEQYMMWMKAKLAGDGDARDKIMSSDNPVEQMKIGDKLTTLDKADWDRRSLDLMKPGALAKFQQNPELKFKLLSTRELTLAEASGSNLTWGIGIRLDDPDLGTKRWRGENRLGNLLMDIRKAMRD